MTTAGVLKFLGAGLVILAGALGGGSAAAALEKRLSVLEELRAALERLRSQIEYHSAPLAAALDAAAKPCSGESKELLLCVAENLRSGDGAPAGEAWSRALDLVGSGSHLNVPDIAALRLLGPALGASDRKDQARHLESMIGNLGVHIREARDRSAKYALLYRQMGVLCGALVALLLT